MVEYSAYNGKVNGSTPLLPKKQIVQLVEH